ncbi:MAG: phosphoribosyltransferase family protein [Candidatus Eisenbacteria bacterium]
MSGPLAPRALPILRSLFAPLLEFALPQRCPGCGAAADPARVLCADCLARIPTLATPLCARCLAEGGDGAPCSRHPGFAVYAPWQLDERARAVVHLLKYGGRPDLAAALGPALAAAVGKPARAPDLVVAVPLHRARRRERGYNQAEALARALARELRVPYLPGALVRTRATAAQARLGGAARRRNLAGAFVIEPDAALAGRSVLVVDDVITTGATLEACLAALRAGKARGAGVALAWAP